MIYVTSYDIEQDAVRKVGEKKQIEREKIQSATVKEKIEGEKVTRISP